MARKIKKPRTVPAAGRGPAPAEPAQTPEDIANEIEQNITRMMDVSEPAEPARPSMDSTIKFTNLQFGRNYDPTSDR